jgi:diguanylate cyclase (GGDEF)-like protein
LQQHPHPPHHEWLFAAGMAVLLCLLAAAVFAASFQASGDVVVKLESLADGDGQPSPLSEDGTALLLPGGRAKDFAARLRFTLPATATGQSRWVVWLARSPVDALSLRPGGGSSVQRDFFHPGADEGMLPVGYLFALPADATGEVSIDMHARGSIRSTLRPRVLRESLVTHIAQRGAAVTGALYAALFVLALVALALFSAARDRTFLAFFGYCIAGLMVLAASNGHLFQLPGFGILGAWRAQGMWALLLLFSATTLQTLQRYAGASITMPRLVRAIDGYCIALVVLAAVCLLGLPGVDLVIQPVATAAWVVGEAATLVLIVAAARRQVPMAWPIALLMALSVLASFFTEVAVRANWDVVVWVRYGYQLAVVMCAATLGVGLISRIGEYRDQRDRERQARADSEGRMRREAARSELGNALQTRLRTLAAGDVEWSAFRMLLDALLPQVPADSAAVVAYGYHGHDVLVVDPLTNKQAVHDSLAKRGLMLKRLAALAMPLQQPGTSATNPANSLVTEAVIPLSIRSPGWGVLLLERAGPEGFTTEELALAGEFARLTLMHADQALAAINLRRSAELDALTGTFNRRTIDQWLARSFSDAVHGGEPLSVLFVDLDHFKAINDRLGHACGDHCLRELAQALRNSLGEGNLLARYGGEEFIAVLPGHGGAAARVIGEQLRSAVENTDIHWEGEVLHLSVSVGVATRLDSETTPASTIDRADKALYAAKRSGRNCVQVAPAVFA